MEEPDAHGLDGGSQLTGPLEPLPGHDELLLTEPLAPPSVPAPVPVKCTQKIALNLDAIVYVSLAMLLSR